MESKAVENATDAAIHVSTMVKIDVIRKVMHAFPQNRILVRETLAEWCQQQTLASDGAVRHIAFRVCSRVAIATRRRRGNGCMRRFIHRVMAIPAVEFQLTRVQFVTERDRLLGLVTNIQCFGRSRGVNHGPDIEAADR